ncbi:hypothetical protein EVAR_56757_1 [Eumeta japonica]|uniref:Uncharacterized protein n=1 Tax=Eumeta variegata TaxID=151549 RepID=A0A4C1XRA0_EUMVA|nr:hypothetical protein EVAR_56757_1 [Eumeta japonica]
MEITLWNVLSHFAVGSFKLPTGYSIPTQEAGSGQVTLLELRVSMDDDDQPPAIWWLTWIASMPVKSARKNTRCPTSGCKWSIYRPRFTSTSLHFCAPCLSLATSGSEYYTENGFSHMLLTPTETLTVVRQSHRLRHTVPATRFLFYVL